MRCKTPLGLCSRRAEEQGLLLGAAASSGENTLGMTTLDHAARMRGKVEKAETRSRRNYPFLETEIMFPKMILFLLLFPSRHPTLSH